MELFLKQVARHLLENHKDNLYDYWLVFPNKRTGLFFKTWLSELSDDPVFTPPTFSIDKFISEFTPLEEMDQLGALFELYKVNKNILSSEDTFDDFYFWGEMLMNDFDDIDKYLVDARQLYTNLLNIKEIDQFFLEREDEDQQQIRQFWEEIFKTQKPGTEEFIKTWESLYPVYKSFRETLKEKNSGTKGMLYKDAVANLKQIEPETLPFKRVGFVGFNALTRAEEALFTALQKTGKADFFWDYTRDMLTSNATSAGYFLKKLLPKFPGVFKETSPINKDVNINVTAVSSASAQSTLAGKIVEDLDNPGLETAVVMADETLLQTMLNKIPENVQNLNVTMGYPIKSSQISALLNQIQALQQRIRFQQGEVVFHYKLVQQLLSNNILQRICPGVHSSRTKMVSENLFYIPETFFNQDPVLKLIFKAVDNGQDVLRYLKQIFESVLTGLNQDEEVDDIPVDPEKEMAFALYTKLVRLYDLFDTSQEVIPGRDLMFKLIKRISDNITIPFEGEPLKGLQLMGILETRNLEFENLIILSANEGFLPSTMPGNSFIPFNLRKGFGLPTVEEQDAMYAYYFYRLIYKARNVHLLYDSTSQGISTGEPSRYIYQLKYLLDLPLKEQSVNYEVSLNKMRKISMGKNGHVLKLLDRFKTGKSMFSASSLNAYLDCPLKFYFSYVERIKEPDDIQDDIDARIFGNVFHDIMESLYEGFTNKVVQKDDIAQILKQKQHIEATVKLYFARHFFKNKSLTDTSRLKGKLLIYVKVLIKYTTRLLKFDADSCPFTYVAGEKQESLKITLRKGDSVQLFGKIDRVDIKDGAIRILDYKSGTIDTNFKNQVVLKDFDKLFERDTTLKPDQKAIFQTLFYAMLYAKNNGASRDIKPGIVPIRLLFGNSTFTPSVFENKEKSLNYKDISRAYEERVMDTIEQIFDESLSFNQTSDINTCKYCDFKTICGR